MITIIIFCSIMILFPLYPIYLTYKWYNKGYKDTVLLFNNNNLGKVENPSNVKHSCNENKWYHYGCYDAYCKLKVNK